MSRRRRPTRPLVRVLACALSWSLGVSCSRGPEAADASPTPPAADSDAAPTRATPDADPPRARSEPPPGPPRPPGVQAFRADVVTLALSGDGRFLAGGDLGGRALFWDLSRAVFVTSDLTPDGNRIRPVVFADQGTAWLAGAFDHPDHPWRLYRSDAAGAAPSFLGEARAAAVDAAFDRVGARVAIASAAPDDVAVVELATSARLWHLATRADSVALDAAGATVAWSDGPRAKVVAVADGRELLAVEEAAPIARLALGDLALAAAVGPRVVSWALAGGARSVVALADERRPIRELRWVGPSAAPDATSRRLVAVTRSSEDGIILWDGASGTPLAEVRMGCPCEVHALSADGCSAACACAAREEVRWARVSGPTCAGAPAPAADP